MLSSDDGSGLDELPSGVSPGTEAEADEDGAGGELLEGSESYVVVDEGSSELNEKWEVDTELVDAPDVIR